MVFAKTAKIKCWFTIYNFIKRIKGARHFDVLCGKKLLPSSNKNTEQFKLAVLKQMSNVWTTTKSFLWLSRFRTTLLHFVKVVSIIYVPNIWYIFHPFLFDFFRWWDIMFVTAFLTMLFCRLKITKVWQSLHIDCSMMSLIVKLFLRVFVVNVN